MSESNHFGLDVITAEMDLQIFHVKGDFTPDAAGK